MSLAGVGLTGTRCVVSCPRVVKGALSSCRTVWLRNCAHGQGCLESPSSYFTTSDGMKLDVSPKYLYCFQLYPFKEHSLALILRFPPCTLISLLTRIYLRIGDEQESPGRRRFPTRLFCASLLGGRCPVPCAAGLEPCL